MAKKTVMPGPKKQQAQTPQSSGPDRYKKKRAEEAKRRAEESKEGREIGPLPKVKNPARKKKCQRSLQKFIETYLRDRFWLAWSKDQLQVIARLERAILKGGMFALAMPRGSGKTALSEAAALWAIAYGHRRFVVVIGAENDAAIEILDSIKIWIETNDVLNDDFPEMCYPVRCLDGIHHRANGQTLNGARTRISWKESRAVFATVEGAACSGARIFVAGITGRIRGMKVALASGESIRPDFALVDDPQTDQSAESLIEIVKREKRIKGACKGLAGPGKTISMVVTCTIIARDDVAARILDRDRNPQFVGERFQAVYAFPTDTEKWDRYKELRIDSFKAGRNGEEATAYYLANREAMDAGAVVAWPARYDVNAGEFSGLQAMMNQVCDDPHTFHAEYQNDPLKDEEDGARLLVADLVAARLSRTPRYVVPRLCTRLTAFIDCGTSLLWWATVAWDERFNGTVIDYGSWPEQRRDDFFAADARPVMADLHRNLTDDQRLYAALGGLTGQILGRVYQRNETGEQLKIERCLIDSGFEEVAVLSFIQRSPHSAILLPSKGYAEKVGRSSMNQWPKKDGERAGDNWRIGAGTSSKGRVVKVNVDGWKSFVYDRLTSVGGGGGYLDFFGDDVRRHSMIARHCTAERGMVVDAEGRHFVKWVENPGGPDNHLWDCLVGCAVGASIQGLQWQPSGQFDTTIAARPKMKLSEIQAAKRAARIARK